MFMRLSTALPLAILCTSSLVIAKEYPLEVSYVLTKQGSNEQIKGTFHPMVANDGPHYGDNIKLMGPGKYNLKYTVLPPSKASMFGRHTDKETGVEPWFNKCETSYDFTYAGIGKKGGY